MTVINRSIVSPAVQDLPLSDSVPLTSAIVRNSITAIEITLAGRTYLAGCNDCGYYSLRDATTLRGTFGMTREEFDRLVIVLTWFCGWAYYMEAK